MILEVVLKVWSLWLVLISAIVSFVVAFILKKRVDVADPGNEEMVKVQGYIRDGASTFIKRQYTTLAFFVGGLAIIIAIVYSGNHRVPWYLMMISYILGSLASAWAGWFGMKVGVDANAKTAQASTKGLAAAFNVSFFAGAVMGLIVTGAALGGVWLLYFIFGDPLVILGFSFGASSIALFAKAGGGIYTKTADVAADLVGKVEYSLPEDDPRNPASIADNVGDNVGDIAGMGADLFDSYVASILGAMLLAYSMIKAQQGGLINVDVQVITSFPIVISGAGLIASIIGIFIIGKMGKTTPGKALNLGTYIATLLFMGIGALFTYLLTLTDGTTPEMKIKLWKNLLAGIFGVGSGLVIGFTTDYFTNDEKRPTQRTAESSEQGHALNILTGFSYGLLSVAPPIIGIVIAMAIAYYLDGLIGVANASTGMLAIVGTIVSNDAYGPIVDNARGIAEQGGLSENEIALCDRLDSAGNTAKAITKGFAIGAAALTVLALLYAFIEEAKNHPDVAQTLADMEIITLDLMTPQVMISALIGTAVPLVYSAVLIMAVDKNAQVMVKEIRRQFEENPAILKGDEPADFKRCIDIATKGSLKELVVPIILSIASPVLVGMLFGVQGLGAFLASSILIGFVFALLLSNSGGMWDNAKKYIEDGNLGGKGTFAHAAAITGDTVGDPFKDTAGPSINTLICVMSLTASVFLSLFMLDIFNNGQGLLMNLFV